MLDLGPFAISDGMFTGLLATAFATWIFVAHLRHEEQIEAARRRLERERFYPDRRLP